MAMCEAFCPKEPSGFTQVLAVGLLEPLDYWDYWDCFLGSLEPLEPPEVEWARKLANSPILDLPMREKGGEEGSGRTERQHKGSASSQIA